MNSIEVKLMMDLKRLQDIIKMNDQQAERLERTIKLTDKERIKLSTFDEIFPKARAHCYTNRHRTVDRIDNVPINLLIWKKK